ncbi:MAG: transglutaminase domain-containing protein, partial [Acidimicrobiales bacterium]|nr:transglutaminase domain-containing protein [Acidimicrobiales bacterium]
LGITGWERAGRQLSRLVPILAVGGVAIGVSLPATQLDHALHRHPLNPRQAVSAAIHVPPTADPLSLVPFWLEHPNQVLFTAQVGSAWDRLRPFWSLVSYDDYNGATWAGRAQAVAVGYQVPGSRPGAASVSPVGLEAENLGGVWVPIPGPVHTVNRVGLGYAASSRELVDPSGVNGKRYGLQVYLPNYQVESLRAAAVPQGSAAANLVSVPSCVTPELSRLAHNVSSGARLPIQQAVALQGVLSAKSGFALDNNAPQGDSCARVSQFLLHDHVGTADQFATTFVLMARSIGLPARLVVGFEPGTASDNGRFVTVTGGDAFVFPEVELARVGWVPIDATPKGGAQSGKGLSQTQLAEIEHAGQAAPATSNPTLHHHAAPVATRHRPLRHRSGFPVLLAVAVPLGILALVVLGLFAVTRARRWRRRHARRPPPTRVTLAWHHVLDRLVDHRVAVKSLTPAEALEAVSPLAPRAAEPVGQLGVLVERAVYDSSAISEREANEAWVEAVAADRELRRTLPRGTRCLTALGFHPRRTPAGTAPARP